jgi:aminoglycoside phosphotransferase (APT) family kinase protein
VPVDPRQPDEIAVATLRWIRGNIDGAAGASWTGSLTSSDAGLSTFIWFGQLVGDDLPDAFRTPLALRVFGDVTEDETLARESTVMGFVAAHGYPAPVPLAAVPSGAENPVGLPWVILPKVPGDLLLAVISRAPWAALARVRELASLQARLHAISSADCPLPDAGSLVDRWFALRSPEIEGIGDARANAVLAALRQKRDVVRTEERVVCHGDFHPLNVLSERRAGAWHHVVIDWTDAVIGDRHFDVARTLALFRVAAIAANTKAERIGLGAAAPGLVRTYRRAYERVHPLEPDRLSYWSAVHLLRGWAQITQLHDGAYESSRATGDAVPLSVADVMLERAERAVATLR